ncbi:hypothetical protein F5B20DRAFT_135877 [Whalleya microplaca]|nr:hypothetical protein F5B20DRAFT_135877 [Whalleya microplaca]
MAGPAIKQRRKASSKSKATTPHQHASSSISSFARVSKTITQTDIKKEPATTPRKDIKLEAITPASRKRKVVTAVEDDSSADERPSKAAPTSISKTPTQPAKRGRGRPSKKARAEPAPRKRARSPSVSDSEASVINSGALFKKLRLESSPSRCSSPLTADTSAADSDADAYINFKKPRQLPDEVLSLVNLHASLLKALTLHYAHNGTHVPADLRLLCPNVARAWGKKQVTDADIRLCIGVLNSDETTSTNNTLRPFSLSDYGRGKICIEIDPAHGSGPLDEKKLNDVFRANLEHLWSRFTTTTTTTSNDASAFTQTLPRAPITLCASVSKAAPVLSRGQKQLEELKQGLALKKQNKAQAQTKGLLGGSSSSTTTATTPATNADGTKMSLLDRLRLKAQQKAAMPAGLSPAQLSRRAALQRVDEVAAMVGMLSRASSGDGRISFSMGAMLEKLKDSFRMGISRDEGATCVRLLAAEVAPEWLRVVTVGGRENVVVETDRLVSKAEIAGRVRAILERE